MIRIGYPLLDRIDAYFVSGETIIDRVKAGDSFEFDQRRVKSRNFIFPIDTHDEVKVYLKKETTSLCGCH